MTPTRSFLSLASLATLLVAGAAARAETTLTPSPATEGTAQALAAVRLQDRGRSGALKVAILQPGTSLGKLVALGETGRQQALAYRWAPVARLKSASADYLSGALQPPARPGVWRLEVRGRPSEVAVITPVHFDGSKSHLNGYHIGRYPARADDTRGEAYAPPVYFVEVTRENQHTYVSRHFQLRQFLTKDQADVWPKYLALDLRLVDKLELVIQELRASGRRARGLHVMSGYRTPQYNGPGKNGRARFSRHTYGDAADVWVDDDRDGRMDDLNRDGRVDVRDAQVFARAVERVEARYPELVGGHGVYKATPAHGPFVHVDVRGTAARWAAR